MVVNYEQDRKKKESVRFIDYFFVCGLAEDKLLEVYKHHEDNDFSKFLEKKLVASILCHFPDNLAENPWRSDELWKLCIPGGVQVHIGDENSQIPDERFHTFVLTREDGSKFYGHVLTFFEPCTSDELAYNIADVLQCDHLQPEQRMYVEKCFGFITPSPFINACESILSFLHRRFVLNKPLGQEFSFESYIYNLLYEVPPLTYNCSCKVACITERNGKSSLIIQKPARNELPQIDINLSQILRLLGGASNLINLLTSVLLERSILLVSKENRMQMHVAEGITSLLFPFRWPHAVVSVLPVDLAVHFFDAPVPYIIGVVVPANMKIALRRELKVNQCYVDLDNAMVECPEDQPGFPGQEELVSKLNSFMSRYEDEVLASTGKSVAVSAKIRSKRSASKAQRDLVESSPKEGAMVARSRAGSDEKVVESLHAVVMPPVETTISEVEAKKFSEDRFNTSVRETIASCFVGFFFQYDKFIIQPTEDANGSWQYQTDEIFDKTSFISDQPECRLPFLLPFLDTMMFAYLIDSWLLSQQLPVSVQNDQSIKDPYLRLFDDRIDQVKVLPEARTPVLSPEPSSGRFRTLSMSSNNMFTTSNHVEAWIRESEQGFKRRMTSVDFVSSPLHALNNNSNNSTDEDAVIEVKKETKQQQQQDRKKTTTTTAQHRSLPGRLPKIKASLLECEGIKKRYLRRMNDSRRTFKRQSSRSDSRWRKLAEFRSKLLSPPNMSEFSPEVIARTNWKFVEKLLNDVRVKTKRLLIGKMGQEAVALGWSEIGIAGLEENTWIAGLCDLLERVWGHGLLTNQRKGKSALWSHLIRFHAASKARHELRLRDCPDGEMCSRRQIGGSTPSIVDSSSSNLPSTVGGGETQQQQASGALPSGLDTADNYYHSLPRSFLSSTITKHHNRDNKVNSEKYRAAETALLASLRKIMAMRDVHTEVGRSRAWIRLALEQKKLHDYLSHLLSDSDMLNEMYKKYSLLQCEDERQQFLYHLLTLKTADFNSFTNSFTKTEIEYRVVMYPSRQLSLASGGTSANVYIRLHGELRHTNVIDVPKGSLDFTFKHQNLGFITSLIIGHDNYGVFPNWRLNFITVTNEVTGQVYAFPCFRSLGRGVDDSSIERLLIARQLPLYCDVTKQVERLAEQASKRTSVQVTIPELQEKVGQSVNNLITFFNKTHASHASLSGSNSCFVRLLVNGLVASLFEVFSHGLKKNKGRFIQRKPAYAWELMTAVKEKLQGSPRTRRKASRNNSIISVGSNSSNNQFFAGDFFLGSRSVGANTINVANNATVNGFLSDSRNDLKNSDGKVPYKSEASILRERESLKRLCHLYQRIQIQGQYRLGKDDMMSLLLCVGIHEHGISYWLPFVASVAQNMSDIYEDNAFLCDAEAVVFLAQVLNMLELYEIPLDDSLLRGLGQTLLDNA